MFGPGRGDHRQFFGGDTRHLGELRDVLLEHRQGTLAKVAHDALGGLGPHPVDHAGAQVFFQGPGGGRTQLNCVFRLELPTKFGVLHPGAGKLHGGPGKDPHLVNGHGLQFAKTGKRRYPQNRPTTGLVVVGDPLHYTTNFFLNIRLFQL